MIVCTKSDLIAIILRSRGYDVVSAHEVGMRGKEEKEQLALSHNEWVIILTTKNTKVTKIY